MATRKPLVLVGGKSVQLPAGDTLAGPLGSFTYIAQPATTGVITDRQHIAFTNVASSSVTLPATPAEGDMVTITVANGLRTNTVDPGAQTITGSTGVPASGVLTLDSAVTISLRFINSSWRII